MTFAGLVLRGIGILAVTTALPVRSASAEPDFDFSPLLGYEVMSCGAGYDYDPAVRDCVELGQAQICPPGSVDVDDGCLCPGEILVPFGTPTCPGPTPTNVPPTPVPPTPTPVPPTNAPPTPTTAVIPTTAPTAGPTVTILPEPTDAEGPGPSTTPAGIQNVPGTADSPALPVFLFVMIAGVLVLLLWARRERR